MRVVWQATEDRFTQQVQDLDLGLMQCQGEVWALRDFIQRDREQWAYCYGCAPGVFPKECRKCFGPLRYGPDAKADRKVRELAKQLAEMMKDMEEEKEDLHRIAEQVNKAIRPRLPKGSQEQLAIEALEAWKRKRLLQIERRQRILEETHRALKTVLAPDPIASEEVEAAQERAVGSPRRTTIVSALNNLAKRQQRPEALDRAAMDRILGGARVMPKEVPFGGRMLPPNASHFSMISPTRPNGGGGQLMNLHSLLPAEEHTPMGRDRGKTWSPRSGKHPGDPVLGVDPWRCLNGPGIVPMPPREPYSPRTVSRYEAQPHYN